MKERTKEQELQNWIEWLQEGYDDWLKYVKNGLSDPHYTDGYNMNFARKLMSGYKERIAELCTELSLSLPPVYHLPLPPLVPDNYMVKPKETQKRRWELLEEWNPTNEKNFTYNEKDFVYEKYNPIKEEQLSFDF